MTIHCGLVVRNDVELLDEELLELIAARTGRRFTYLGSGGFGVELFATVYRDEQDNGLTLAKAIEAPVTAVVFRIGEVADAVAVRQVVADHLGGWSEQMLREQVAEDGIESQPGVLVAMAMAGGGGPLDDETVDLINSAVHHPDATVAEWAALAVRVASELQHPPIVITEKPRSPAPAILPPQPVDRDECWITARAGVTGRELPPNAIWLRVADPDDEAVLSRHSGDADWSMEVVGHTTDEFEETIFATEDGQTAIHQVKHSALDAPYVVVHGAQPGAVIELLGDTVVPIEGTPTGHPLTAP